MVWEVIDNKLRKTFEAKSFSDIASKLLKISIIADQADHHPDFKVWGYNKIEFSLSTHTSNSVTDLDYQLAKEIDMIFEN